MPDPHDGRDANLVADRRRTAFCYQTHVALDLIRAHFTGQKLATAIAIYVSFTEAANRNGGHAARDGFEAQRKDLADATGVSIDTLDRYAKELEEIGLLTVERRQIGRVHLPNVWVLVEPETAPPTPPGRTAAARGSRTGAAPRARSSSEPKKTSKEEEHLSENDKMKSPPKLVNVEGRNLALDALADVCALTPDEPAYKQAIGYLNGRKAQGVGGGDPERGIVHLAWGELAAWAEHDPATRVPKMLELHAEPERWQQLLDSMIRAKATRYREKMTDVFLTAKALRDWWLRLERLDSLVGGRSLSAADVEKMPMPR